MKSKTNISVVSNTGVRRKSEVIIGDSGTYTSGDILDANAVEQLVNSKSGGGAGGVTSFKCRVIYEDGSSAPDDVIFLTPIDRQSIESAIENQNIVTCAIEDTFQHGRMLYTTLTKKQSDTDYTFSNQFCDLRIYFDEDGTYDYADYYYREIA